MSVRSLSLSPQETIARDRIAGQVAARHRAPRPERTRPHVRAALLLRSLAERLDPPELDASAERRRRPALRAVPPHAGSPRPWTAAPRRAPHRHS